MTLVGLAGVLFVLSVGGGLAPRLLSSRLADSRLQDITGVGAGLLLASALLIVIPEGFHLAAVEAEADHVFTNDPVVLGAAVLAGFALMLFLEGLGVGHAVHEEHHDHHAGHGHGHIHHPSSPVVAAIGLSVHAIADGLAIGTAAVAGDAAFSALVALAVLLHRVPAAFSLGLFALHETQDRSRVTLGIVAFAAATPLAILVSYLLLQDASHQLISLALLFSAGTFVYVATVDTFPEIHNPSTGRRSVLMVLVGALLFTVVFVAFDKSGLLDHAH